MQNEIEQKTASLKKLQEVYEAERDKLYDQVANLNGQKERLDWAIRVINAFVTQIKKEEEQKIIYAKQQEEAMKIAKEAKNVGAHPSERKSTLVERRKKKVKKSKKEE